MGCGIKVECYGFVGLRVQDLVKVSEVPDGRSVVFWCLGVLKLGVVVE